jgi:hypothetical protein
MTDTKVLQQELIKEKAIAIIKASKNSGPITLKADAEGLDQVSLPVEIVT